MWLFDYLNPKMWKIKRDYRLAVKEGKVIEYYMKREWNLNWLINCIAPIIGTGIIACLFFADKDSVFFKFTNDYYVSEIFEILTLIGIIIFIVFYVGILVGDNEAQKKVRSEAKLAIDYVKYNEEFEFLLKKESNDKKLELETNAFRDVSRDGVVHLVEVTIKDLKCKNTTRSYFFLYNRMRGTIKQLPTEIVLYRSNMEKYPNFDLSTWI